MLKTYFLMLTAFLAIDFVWLSIIAKSFYQKHLGFLMADKPNLLAAFIFYLLFVAGILIFVVNPNKEQNISKVIVMGLFFGIVTYATYDLTNFATIKNWPLNIVIVDILWGAMISAIVSIIGYYISK